jgi:trans-2,3-dihydro-3-hydroxyanthranilate isomerase
VTTILFQGDDVRTYPFLQVDAFTSHALAGNACAIVFDADDLDDDTMQAIAREQNLSETAFVRSSAVADFRARFFTPAEEIPFAGHPTLATAFGLAETGRLPLKGELTTVTLELQVGPIRVDLHADGGRVRLVVMNQRRPEFLATYEAAEVLPAFGLSASDALDGVPIQTVSTGTPQLMIPLKSMDALRAMTLDLRRYRALRARGDFFSPHLFCLQGATDAGKTFARHPGVPPDAAEDPFTGSATGGMAAYLWRYGLLEAPTFIAEQGHWRQRPGRAIVEVVGPRESIEAVRVGGGAVTVLRGELRI